MKTRLIFLAACVGFFLATSCKTAVFIPPAPAKTNAHGHVPPGQMKKATGEKSAKAHAPGQNKKKKNK